MGLKVDEPKIVSSVKTLIAEAKELLVGDEVALDRIQRRSQMIVRKLFGEQHHYYNELICIVFPPKHLFTDEDYSQDWLLNTAKIQNLLGTMLGEIELFGLPVAVTNEARCGIQSSKRVFVAHGHDTEMKEEAARTVRKLGLDPIVLEDKASEGRTIIEKLEHYSDVSFAIVLLSPDDLAYSAASPPASAKPRARQNVVFELGYFIGELGRKNVLVLYKRAKGFEKPSNVDGVMYVPYDGVGKWKTSLIVELQACGHDVSLDKLLHPEATYPELAW